MRHSAPIFNATAMPQHSTLTDIALRAIQPPAHGAATLWDNAVRRFGVRVTSTGVKSFIVLFGNAGRRQVIGRYPDITLAQAREKAKRMLAERTLGRHQAASISWQAAAEKFIEACRAKNRASTHAEYQRTLKRYFGFGTTRLSDISKQDIGAKLERLNKTPSQQAHSLVVCKMFFRWALTSGYVDLDPTAAFKRSRQQRRTRVLSDEELRSIWQACEPPDDTQRSGFVALPASFCTIVQLLILTGQRRGEIAALHTDFFERDICKLPRELCKNDRDHTFPLGPLTAALSAKALPSSSGLLFPARGKPNNAFSGWSKSKTLLDRLSRTSNWTLHDLRRTFRTIHARIGTPPHIAERLINHVNAIASEVAQVYDLHTYLPEMRKAVEAYESHLAALLAQKQPIPRAA